jgi:secondary thiamine-phosphate synthase enzyme
VSADAFLRVLLVQHRDRRPPTLAPPRPLRYRLAMLHQLIGRVEVRAPRQGLHDITDEVEHWVASQGLDTGLLTLFCRHTSASLLIQENAAPAARHDVETYFGRIAPEDPLLYTHDDEGPDDMPAHLRTALTQTQLAIPVENRRMLLGTWQGIYLFEHRRQPSRREIALHLVGE